MRVTAAQLQARIRAAAQPHPLRILKADESVADRFVLGVSYPAQRLDGHEEFMRDRTVELTAWRYMLDGGRQVGLQHEEEIVGIADVVESYIWRADPWVITDTQGREQRILPGDWLLGAILDRPAWRLAKAGKITGWSIDGVGHRVPVDRVAAALREASA